MEKNIYIAPECEVVEMETMPLMVVVSNTNETDESDPDDMGANRYRPRGEWGNLWSDWE